MRITKQLAKAIVCSPNFGELALPTGVVHWIKKIVYVWPSCQPLTKIDIYFNDDHVGRCDLSWLRERAAN